MHPLSADARCPCLSGNSYGSCCARFHEGLAAAPTAEALMRSRFSAFAVGNPSYLRATWHPSTRPTALDLDPDLTWYRLDILGKTRGGPLDTDGTVEFRAFCKGPDGRSDQHEVSRFLREDRQWFYLDAVV
jgi:SEC-C motif-containing protein